MVIVILFQQNEAGLGSAFGGSNAGGSGFRQKRGLEKQLFFVTIILAVLFVGSAVLALFI